MNAADLDAHLHRWHRDTGSAVPSAEPSTVPTVACPHCGEPRASAEELWFHVRRHHPDLVEDDAELDEPAGGGPTDPVDVPGDVTALGCLKQFGLVVVLLVVVYFGALQFFEWNASNNDSSSRNAAPARATATQSDALSMAASCNQWMAADYAQRAAVVKEQLEHVGGSTASGTVTRMIVEISGLCDVGAVSDIAEGASVAYVYLGQP